MRCQSELVAFSLSLPKTCPWALLLQPCNLRQAQRDTLCCTSPLKRV